VSNNLGEVKKMGEERGGNKYLLHKANILYIENIQPCEDLGCVKNMSY